MVLYILNGVFGADAGGGGAGDGDFVVYRGFDAADWYTPAYVAERCGIDAEDLVAAARLFATAEAEGFLQRDIDGRSYSPGRRMRILSINTLSSERIRTVRLAVLKALALEVGETWTYTYDYVVLQSDIDSNATNEPGDVTAGELDNTATADTDQTGPLSDSEAVELTQDPSFTIAKVLVDINDDVTDTVINAAGDVLTYQVTLFNDGNQSLTGVTLADPLVADAVGTRSEERFSRNAETEKGSRMPSSA